MPQLRVRHFTDPACPVDYSAQPLSGGSSGSTATHCGGSG